MGKSIAERIAELREEVINLRKAGWDPANMVRCRLLEICEELLDIYQTPEERDEWKQRMRDSSAAYSGKTRYLSTLRRLADS